MKIPCNDCYVHGAVDVRHDSRGGHGWMDSQGLVKGPTYLPIYLHTNFFILVVISGV